MRPWFLLLTAHPAFFTSYVQGLPWYILTIKQYFQYVFFLVNIHVLGLPRISFARIFDHKCFLPVVRFPSGYLRLGLAACQLYSKFDRSSANAPFKVHRDQGALVTQNKFRCLFCCVRWLAIHLRDARIVCVCVYIYIYIYICIIVHVCVCVCIMYTYICIHPE